jgi:AraC family transcriptional regulator
MDPLIKLLPEKKLAGKRMKMTLANNMTHTLWKSFMLGIKEIKNKQGSDLYSIQVYDSSFRVENFNETTLFEKWAAIEVADFSTVPNEMEAFTLPGGLYAVFKHKGAAITGPTTFKYIFGAWLPNSAYVLDNRPHFEILGEKYKNNNPNSEEDICIPVKEKK